MFLHGQLDMRRNSHSARVKSTGHFSQPSSGIDPNIRFPLFSGTVIRIEQIHCRTAQQANGSIGRTAADWGTTWREESKIVAERPSSGAAALTYSLHTIIIMSFVHTTSVMRAPYILQNVFHRISCARINRRNRRNRPCMETNRHS